MTWDKILETSFGVRWADETKESKGIYEDRKSLWIKDLSETVYGWRNASGDQINDELCNALRYVSNMEPMPRADIRQSSAKYNCRDLKKWITMYRAANCGRSNKHIIDVGCSNSGVSDMIKRYIADDLIPRGMIAKATECAEDPAKFLHFTPAMEYTAADMEDVKGFLSTEIAEKASACPVKRLER